MSIDADIQDYFPSAQQEMLHPQGCPMAYGPASSMMDAINAPPQPGTDGDQLVSADGMFVETLETVQTVQSDATEEASRHIDAAVQHEAVHVEDLRSCEVDAEHDQAGDVSMNGELETNALIKPEKHLPLSGDAPLSNVFQDVLACGATQELDTELGRNSEHDTTQELAADQAALAALCVAEGRVHMAAGNHCEALAKFTFAASAWKACRKDELRCGMLPWADECRFAEVVFKGQVSAAELLLQSGSKDEAISCLKFAREVILSSSSSMHWMSAEILEFCYRQALVHRKHGQASTSAELLSLALAVLRQCRQAYSNDATTESRLLRQLALSYLQASRFQLARAHAHEAVAQMAPGSKGRAAALRVLLHVLCCATPAKMLASPAEIGEMRDVALELMKQAEVPMDERLAACKDLLRNAGTEAVAHECFDVLSRSSKEDTVDMCRILLTRLYLIAEGFIKLTPESGGESAFQEMLAEVERLEDQALEGIHTALLDALTCAVRFAVTSGNHDRAIQWQTFKLKFLKGKRDVSDERLLLVFCHIRAGRFLEAHQEAEAVLAKCPNHFKAMSLLLFSKVRRAEQTDADHLLQMISGHPDFSKQSVLLERALHACKGDEEERVYMDAVWNEPHQRWHDIPRNVEENMVSNFNSGELNILRAARARLQLAVVLRLSPAEIVDFISMFYSAFEQYKAASSQEASGIDNKTGTSPWDIAIKEAVAAVQCACLHVERLRTSKSWSACVAVLVTVMRLISGIHIRPQERACFTANLARALVNCAADEGGGGCEFYSGSSSEVRSPQELRKEAVDLIAEARDDLEVARSDMSKRNGRVSSPYTAILEPTPSLSQISALLWLLEAQVYCYLGDESVASFMDRIRIFTQGPYHDEDLPPLLAMAQAIPCETPRGSELITMCLQAHLQVSVDKGVPFDGRANQCVAQRELLKSPIPHPVQQLANLTFAFSMQGLQAHDGKVDLYGGEILWLLAFAVRTSVRLQLLGELTTSQQWVEAALNFLDKCPQSIEDNIGCGARRALQTLSESAARCSVHGVGQSGG